MFILLSISCSLRSDCVCHKLLSIGVLSVCGGRFLFCFFFFFKQKTAYEGRISYWSSVVCSSDLGFAGIIGLLVAAGLDWQKPVIFCGMLALVVAAAVFIVLHRVSIGERPPRPASQKAVVRSTAGWGIRDRRGFAALSPEERRVGKGCVRTCRTRWLACN